MKAFQINSFDGPQSGSFTDSPNLAPAVGEVVIEIKAASVNPLDLKIISGFMTSVFPIDFPYVPGTDFSGIVSSAGDRVTNVKPGDYVVGRMEPTQGGAFAQQVLISAEKLHKLSAGMSFEQAAALPTAYGTANLALMETANLQARQRVLIHGGAGGVGSFAVQIAKLAGAYVIATASGKNTSLLHSLGADEVIDYRTQDFAKLTDIDAVLDSIGGETLDRSWSVLNDTGIIVSLADFNIKNNGTKRGEFVFFSDAKSAMSLAMKSFEQHQLQIVMDSIYSLDETRVALEKIGTGHARGKITVRT